MPVVRDSWRSSVRADGYGCPVEIQVEPGRLSFRRTESIIPASLPAMVIHDSNFVLHGRSWLAPPWVNHYLVFTRHGEVYVAGVLNHHVGSLLAALDAAGFEVRHVTDWRMMMSGRAGSRQVYKSHMETLGASDMSTPDHVPDAAPIVSDASGLADSHAAAPARTGRRRALMVLTWALTAAASLGILGLFVAAVAGQQTQVIPLTAATLIAAALAAWGFELADAGVCGRAQARRLSRSLWAARPAIWIALMALFAAMTRVASPEAAIGLAAVVFSAVWLPRRFWPLAVRSGDLISLPDPGGTGFLVASVTESGEQWASIDVRDKAAERPSLVSPSLLCEVGQELRLERGELDRMNPKLIWRSR